MTAAKRQNASAHYRKPLPGHWKAFFLALGAATLIFLPFIIMGKGYFTYYGDFNVQQIPFYKLAHQAVRSGNVFWDWNTDLGTNFIGSYSFYLLFSPFFWLTLPFPNSFVPYLMGPLLILKTACAALTSYLYIKRFVRKSDYAVMGSLLYAFSGWMMYNVFFNHFHDVAVFFPLLLLAVEQLITEEKIGYVALAVALNAMVNYWFFIGEVVFVIIYVIVRTYSRGWRMTWKKFFQLGIEAVLGILLAAFALLPSVLALMGNPRTGTDRLLSGWGFWIYWHNFSENGSYPQRLPAILSSLFFPPDLPAYPNLFPNHGAKWASLSAWFPMFGMTGVFAYFNQDKTRKDWLRKLLGLCLFFALIPGLNSLFVLFNNSYYARWFYMPLLLMAVATARAIENSADDQKSFAVSLKWVLLVTGIFMVAIGLTPEKVDGKWKIGLSLYPERTWIWFAMVVVGLLLVAVLLIRFRFHKKFQKYVIGAILCCAIAFQIPYMAMGHSDKERSDRLIETAIRGPERYGLPEQEPFARSDIYDDTDNLLMFWGLPNIQTFHSVVTNSIIDFYPTVGVKRDVGSRPEADYYPLRSLLSVRWLFIQQEKEEQEPMPGYSFYEMQGDYNVYENEYYLPMGFTYDSYIDRETLDTIPTNSRGHTLLEALCLEEEGIQRNRDILQKMEFPAWDDYSTETFYESVRERQRDTATDFAIQRKGFTARTDFSGDELVFFSVPYEEGWSATVNGEAVPIEKANIGFMAVRVPAGAGEIVFSYRTPGLVPGILISCGGALVFLAVGLMVRKRQTARQKALKEEQQWLAQSDIPLSWDEYLARYNDRQRVEIREVITNRSVIQAFEEGAPDWETLIPFAVESEEDPPADPKEEA